MMRLFLCAYASLTSLHAMEDSAACEPMAHQAFSYASGSCRHSHSFMRLSSVDQSLYPEQQKNINLRAKLSSIYSLLEMMRGAGGEASVHGQGYIFSISAFGDVSKSNVDHTFFLYQTLSIGNIHIQNSDLYDFILYGRYDRNGPLNPSVIGEYLNGFSLAHPIQKDHVSNENASDQRLNTSR